MLDAVFLELLQLQNLFPGDLKEQVRARATRMEKAVWFLENAIEHPLNIDNFEPLCKLLTVMADDMYLKHDAVKHLATKIEQEIDKETSLITTKQKAKGCYILRTYTCIEIFINIAILYIYVVMFIYTFSLLWSSKICNITCDQICKNPEQSCIL